jgi:hypothetical protein
MECDETKPSCERCKAYGVACNYTGDTKTSDLEIVFNGTVIMKARPQSLSQASQAIPKPTVQPFMYPAVYSSDSNCSFKLNSEEIDRLGRFQSRTILAIGTTKSAKLFQSIIIELACTVSSSHPPTIPNTDLPLRVLASCTSSKPFQASTTTTCPMTHLLPMHASPFQNVVISAVFLTVLTVCPTITV